MTLIPWSLKTSLFFVSKVEVVSPAAVMEEEKQPPRRIVKNAPKKRQLKITSMFALQGSKAQPTAEPMQSSQSANDKEKGTRMNNEHEHREDVDDDDDDNKEEDDNENMNDEKTKQRMAMSGDYDDSESWEPGTKYLSPDLWDFSPPPRTNATGKEDPKKREEKLEYHRLYYPRLKAIFQELEEEEEFRRQTR